MPAKAENILGIWDGHGRGTALVSGDRLVFSFCGSGSERGFPEEEAKKAAASLKEMNIGRVTAASAGISGRAPVRIFDGLYGKVKGASDPLKPSARFYRHYENVAGKIPVFNRLESAAGRYFLKKRLLKSGIEVKDLVLTDHHTAHSAASFFKSPFEESLVITMDGYGDGSSGMVSQWKRERGLINVVTKFSYVNSLAYLFGLFTRMLGFDEGEENAVEKLAGSGSFDKKLSDSTSKIMAFRNGEIVIQSARMRPEIFKKHEKTDIAYALQERLAEVVREMVLFFFKRNPCDTICFGGGLFMNRGIRRFLKECFDERFFVPDVCGDGSLAEGAAFHVSVNNGI